LRAALYLPALAAIRWNPLVLRQRLKDRLKPKQIVAAAMRKLLHLCFGVLKSHSIPTTPHRQSRQP
jgi:hypothetical protein